jgi:hypothetical protein
MQDVQENQNQCFSQARELFEQNQSRTLMTIFGEVIVSRIAYGGRKITSLKPLDGELNLPCEKYSHGLAEKVSQTVAFNNQSKKQ